MTRQNKLDQTVIENAQGLDFIVLDELHTYRGRQGADVAMLVRRLRDRLCRDRPPLCIGTSATMSSQEDETERAIAVANVASRLFGTDIPPDAVIDETLERATDPTLKPQSLGVRARKCHRRRPARRAHRRGASISSAGRLDRARDRAAGRAAASTPPTDNSRRGCKAAGGPNRPRCGALPGAASGDADDDEPPGERAGRRWRAGVSCLQAPPLHLRCGSCLCNAAGAGTSGGSRSTASVSTRRIPTPGCTRPSFAGTAGRSITRSFSSKMAGSLACFRVRSTKPRSRTTEDGEQAGYLMPEPEGDADYAFTGALEDYPEDWLETGPRGGIRLRSNRRRFAPREITVDPGGAVGTTGRRAWFLPGKFHFCPACKDQPPSQAREINKLASLSAEGRSSATTLLVSSALRWMNGAASSVPADKRKLLGFTDNRQDAALQAGHFNDFLFVSLLRAATLAAVRKEGAGGACRGGFRAPGAAGPRLYRSQPGPPAGMDAGSRGEGSGPDRCRAHAVARHCASRVGRPEARLAIYQSEPGGARPGPRAIRRARRARGRRRGL